MTEIDACLTEKLNAALGMTLVEILNLSTSVDTLPESPFYGGQQDGALVQWLLHEDHLTRPSARDVINHLQAKPKLIGGGIDAQEISNEYSRPHHHMVFHTLHLNLRDYTVSRYNPREQSRSWKFAQQATQIKPGIFTVHDTIF